MKSYFRVILGAKTKVAAGFGLQYVVQIHRYMGYVKEELAEANQKVKGIIIALEDDIRIKRALSVTNNIEFYRYQVSFKLFKN